MGDDDQGNMGKTHGDFCNPSVKWREYLKRHDEDPDLGAPCGFCWEMLFAFCPDCHLCQLRPFGSAPCLDDAIEIVDPLKICGSDLNEKRN